MVFGRQLRPYPLLVCRGVGPQVNRDIENSSSRTANEFCLSMWRRLVMHSTKGPAVLVVRDITFDEHTSQSPLTKILRRIKRSKKASMVLEPVRFNDVYAAKFCFS